MQNIQTNKQPLAITLEQGITEYIGGVDKNDPVALKKEKKRWINLKFNSSVPAEIFIKIGRKLYFRLPEFEDYLRSGGNLNQY